MPAHRTRTRPAAAWERDLADRRSYDNEGRIARGRALCDAAIAGTPPPDPTPLAATAGGMLTSCARCFAPHEAPRGTLCPRCAEAEG